MTELDASRLYHTLRRPWQPGVPSAGAFTTLLVDEPTDFTVQFQLYTFRTDFPYLQQTWRLVVL